MASRFPTPFSSSREMRGFDPLLAFHREVDRLFDDVLSGPGGLATGAQAGALSIPRIDLHESEREVSVFVELPGVKPSEVDVRVEGDMLTISGEKKSEVERKQEDYRVMERSYGRFHRMVQLPFAPDPDQVRAECDHGVLTIRMPKQAQQQRSRRIEVQGASQGAQEREQSASAAEENTAAATAAKH